MDRLSQADAVLAAAVAYSPAVIVPGRVLSPMDCDNTIPVTRMMVTACDRQAHDGVAVSRGWDEDILLEDSVHDRTVPHETVPHDVVTDDPVLDAEMVRMSRVLRPAGRIGRTA